MIDSDKYKDQESKEPNKEFLWDSLEAMYDELSAPKKRRA